MTMHGHMKVSLTRRTRLLLETQDITLYVRNTEVFICEGDVT